MSAMHPCLRSFPSGLWRPAVILLALSLLSAVPAFAAEAPAQAQAQAQAADIPFPKRVSGWERMLDRAAAQLGDSSLADQDFEALRGELSGVFNEARAAGATAAENLAQTRQLLDALGPAPAEGAPPEAKEVGAERERLSKAMAELDGRVRQAELVATRADILMRSATTLRMDQFKANLLRKGQSPLGIETWQALPTQLSFLGDRMSRAVVALAAFEGWVYRIAGLSALALACIGSAWAARRWLLRRFGHRDVAEQPSYRQRVAAAGAEAVARCLLPVVPTLALSAALLAMLEGEAAAAPIAAAITSACNGLIFFFLISGMARATLAPQWPAWRLAEVGEDCAAPMVRRATIFAGGLAIAGAVFSTFQSMLVPPELVAVAGFMIQLVATLTLLPLLPARFWTSSANCGCEAPAEEVEADPSAEGETQPASSPSSWRGVRFAAALTAVSALAASAAGYHNLAIYVAELALSALAIGGVLLLLRGVLREAVSVLVERQDGRIASIRRTVIRTDRGLGAFAYTTRLLIDLGLLAIGAAMLLPLSGIEETELQGLADGFLRGITVGGIRIAPADIIAAVVTFVVAVMVTRYVQRQVDERVLQRLHLDRGVQHSIRTGVGYLGISIAILLGVGTLGLDLSSLALIAGALSVGIGFGLQAVVSNFVAGLILLIERPIKVGDWVVVGDKEGLIKRISVRSTEIQTFQRASVIIPNSELISSQVLNWTLKDKFGRVDIKIAVAHGTDLKKLREVLLACTAGDQRISRLPAPLVVFRDFGPNCFNFELRCFVNDVDNSLGVQSDLRFAIVEAFERNGIELFFPKQVVHLPQFEELRELLLTGRAAAGTEAAMAAPAPSASVIGLAAAPLPDRAVS
jgi:potassium-dependent mechanosensitive channel